MMRRLDLSFVRETRTPAWIGPVLLAAGLLAATAATADYVSASSERERLQSQRTEVRKLMRRELPQLARPMGDPTLVAKELDYARLVLNELARPWDALFLELERAATPHVALLGVQPGASGSTVRLRGEARNYSDLLDYIVRLQNTERFADVLLNSHEEQREGGIRFTLTANWIQQQ